MSARYNDVLVVIGGQSQAIMALTGGAETVDDPMASLPVAAVHLEQLLESWMPGVSVTVAGASGPGPTNYTAVGGTALIRSLNGGTAFWNDTTNDFDTHGAAQRDYINARANPSRLCVFVHWSQTADASSASYTNSLYSTSLMNYFTALNTACASNFAEFRILSLMPGARDGGGDVAARIGGMRQICDAISGMQRPFSNATQLSFVLPTAHATPFTPRGAYIAGSPDFVHPIRSSSWRFARAVATRIACHNGIVPPVGLPPRLSHALRINSNTIRAFFVSSAGLPLRRQGSGGFSISSGTITNQAGSFDNSLVSTTHYATIDLSVSGVPRGALLSYWSDMGGYSAFANGTTEPRGLLSNTVWADPGGVSSISDQAEDCTGAGIVLHAQPNQYGVGIY